MYVVYHQKYMKSHISIQKYIENEKIWKLYMKYNSNVNNWKHKNQKETRRRNMRMWDMVESQRERH